MEINLAELGTTLFVGGYLIFGLLLVRVVLFGGSFLPKQISSRVDPQTRIGQLGLGVVVVTVCFGLGMLAEDLSNKFVDTDVFWQNDLFPVLPTERSMKMNALLGEGLSNEVSHLIKEMAWRGILSRYGGEFGDCMELAILCNQPKRGIEWEDSVTLAVYYQAKNAVFKEENYFDEMSKIQTRLDFARSFAILSACMAAIVMLIIFASFIRGITRKNRVKNRIYQPALLLLLVFSACYSLGCFAYVSEEREFNLRAFGYFSSMKADEESEFLKGGKEQCQRLEMNLQNDCRRKALQ